MMEGLYKVDNIQGKGLGWIALEDIKVGTLICKEKLQFVYKEPFKIWNLMEAFSSMSKNDQQKFLELSNVFLDLDSLPDERKKRYFDWKNTAESQCNYDSDLVLKIMSIHSSNGFNGYDAVGIRVGEVGVKVSRINHSCGPNSQHFKNNEGEMEIRATSNILEGQEITISYISSLENFKERQEFCLNLGFVCSCEVCQNEEINNDDEIYQKFQNLKDEAETSFSNVTNDPPNPRVPSSFVKTFDQIEKALTCQKQMYNLAKTKSAPKSFILNLIDRAFIYASCGYASAIMLSYKKEFIGKMEVECEKLSKIGLQIAKMVGGQENSVTKEWKERNQDFQNWYKKNCL